ncbi:MAG: exodeoxyribonuclease VII small subunit [Bacteroidota bacterium]
MSKKALNYQSALEELQTIVAQLEANAIGIDALSEKVKRAAELVQFCQEKLRTTEKKIDTLFEEH